MWSVRSFVVCALVCFSHPFVALAAERDTVARPLPTPRQWKILAALDEQSDLQFSPQHRDLPLSEAIDYLKARHEIEIQLDFKALEETGASTDTPIPHEIKGLTLRSLLRLILTNLDLTYVVGDGYLLITSQAEAENMLSSKVYPVQDLVALDSEFRPPLKAGDRTEADFTSLIELISGTVARTTWDEVGGRGAMKAFPQSQAIAVSQSDEVHEEIALLLASLRRTRDEQLAAAKPVDAVKAEQPTNREQPLSTKVYRLTRRRDDESEHAAAQVAKEEKPSAAAPRVQPSVPAESAVGVPALKAPETRVVAESKLDAWATAIAKLVPEMIEPESWQPKGTGMIHAVGETLVVRQSDDVQHRVGKLINEILPGSVPPAMLVYYPAVRLTLPQIPMRWPAASEPLPSRGETRIAEALAGPCEIDVAEEPLFSVIRKLAEQHHIPIYADEKSLEECGVSSDMPITRSIKGVNLKTTLKLLLDELDLTYVIRNEVLMITSKAEAENMLTPKIYPVFDLVVRPPGAPATRPGLDFRPLIESITSNIAPTTWDEAGGPGEIKSFTNSGALVISQTTAAHIEIAEYLTALRDARAAQ